MYVIMVFNIYESEASVMKSKTIICRISAIIFCIIVMITGMYVPYSEIYSSLSYSATVFSGASRFVYGMGAADEISRIITGETAANISSESEENSSSWNHPLKLFLSSAILPFILLLSWIILNFILRIKFVDKMYLIQFIHNSDGKKGDRSDILMAY